MKISGYLTSVVCVVLVSIMTVDCWTKGRQPRLDPLCAGGVKYNDLPWDCTGYIQCSDKFWDAHWMICPPHLFWSEKAKTCTTDSTVCNNPAAMAKHCERHTDTNITFASPDSCAKYYDCRVTNPRYGMEMYQNECHHPQLYDDRYERCSDPELVNCGKRRRPHSIDDYVLENGPCKGRPDGMIAIPNQPFSNYYLYCSGGETSTPRKCYWPNEVFDPISMKCTTNYKVNLMNFCARNPTAKFPVANNCAKYYDCRSSSHLTNMDTFQTECDYALLYDQFSGTCKPYNEVHCGDRFEPKSPCEYTVGHCTAGGVCIQCGADCKHLSDGKHDNTATTDSTDYLECKDGRTLSIETCPSGFVFSYDDCKDRLSKTAEKYPIQTSGALPVTDITDGYQSTWIKGDHMTSLGDKEAVLVGRGSLVPAGEGINTGTYDPTAVNPTSQDPSTQDGTQSSQAPSTQDGTQSSQTPSTKDGTQSSQDPSTQDGTQSPQDPSTQGGTQSSQDPSTQDGTQSSQTPSTQDGTQSSQTPSTQDGTQSSQDPSTQDGTQSSQTPSTQDGTQSSQTPSTQDGTQSSQDPSTQDGTQSSQTPSTQDGTQSSQTPSTQDGTQSTQNKSTQDGTQSTQNPSTQDGTQSSQDPSTQDGTQSSQTPSTQDGTQSSQDPSTQDGTQSSQTPSTQDGTQSTQTPSTQDGTQSSQDPSTQDGTQSSQDPSTQDGTQSSQTPSTQDGTQSTQTPSTQDGTQSSQDPSVSDSTQTAQDPSQSSPPSEPVIQNVCDCADEVNVAMGKIKTLENFVAEQKQVNALAALECKNPPTLARAKTSLTHTVTGAEATYTCDPGFAFCGSQAVSACPGNGLWDTVDGMCVQSVWNYPRVMFRQKFLCPFAAGTVITIYGTPTRYKKAIIQLDSGTDSALVLTMCFQCGTTQKKVTFGVMEEGVAKDVVTWDQFPFKVGKEFQIVISVTQSAYKIEIDDAPPFFFSHVLPVPHVESVAIIDEITIRKVIIEPANTLQTFMPDLTSGTVPDQSINVKDTMSFTFKVKACENAQFKLATADSATSPSYIVSLGASGNNVSSIRKCDTCNNVAVMWHQILSCTEFKAFWVTWDKGVIKVGSGYIPGMNGFLEVTDSEYPINYFRISQAPVNTIEWILSSPVQKCGLPPPMPDSDVYIQEVGMAAEAVYTCHGIYTFCGESHVSRCTAEGTWEGYKGECLQSTWHMLRMPASIRFPCSFGLGSVLSIHGTPMGVGFAVTLNSGADTLMEMQVSFGKRKVFYNSFINQQAGATEEDTRFHFNYGMEFHLTITVEPTHFKVAHGAELIHEFVHRQPFHSLNSAGIKDAVFVRKVQVFPSEVASSDCQAPSPLPNAQVATTDTTVGSEVPVMCDADHFFCGGSSLMVCDNQGNWNGLDGTCEKGTWSNLGTPTTTGLSRQFPCRYQSGFQITMTGTPMKDETTNPYFRIEIQDNTETLLQMNFHKNELKMNSRLPDLGTEETAALDTLTAGNPVEITVMITDFEFMISGKGSKPIHRYKHRAPPARASAIVFFPSIDITELKFEVMRG